MTPLELLIHSRAMAFRLRHAYELEVWAKKQHAVIHAMAVARARGIASLVNHRLARRPIPRLVAISTRKEVA